MAVEASTSSGNARPPVRKAAEHQMTLPMHSQAAQAAPTFAPRPPEMPIHASAMTPVVEAVEVMDTDTNADVTIDEPESFLYPPLPSLMSAPITPAPVYATPASAAERSGPASDSRPVIRPAVASPIAAASATSSARRVIGNTQTGLAAAHLGIEESEFDKPTYLRRALAGEGGLGTRLPGDGKA
jgi:hypothetical protein